MGPGLSLACQISQNLSFAQRDSKRGRGRVFHCVFVQNLPPPSSPPPRLTPDPLFMFQTPIVIPRFSLAATPFGTGRAEHGVRAAAERPGDDDHHQHHSRWTSHIYLQPEAHPFVESPFGNCIYVHLFAGNSWTTSFGKKDVCSSSGSFWMLGPRHRTDLSIMFPPFCGKHTEKIELTFCRAGFLAGF